MFRLAVLSALGVLGASTGAAHAAEGWYLRGDIGAGVDGDMFFSTSGGSVTIDMDEDFSASAATGYALANGLRIEGEIAHRHNDLEPLVDNLDYGDIDALSATVNFYYDFNRGGAVQPYLGLGVGFARLELFAYNSANPETIDDSVTDLTYQYMAGIGFAVRPNIIIDMGYRHFEAPDIAFDGEDSFVPTVFNSEYSHDSVTLGIRWQFSPS